MTRPAENDTAITPGVEEALRQTFGASAYKVERLAGGLSGASLYTVTAAGRRYAMRVVGKNAKIQAPNQFACMKLAADRGIAPQVHYANAEDGVCISDFIEGRSPTRSQLAEPDMLDSLAILVRHIHDGPEFPPLLTIPDLIEALAPSHIARGAGVFSQVLEMTREARMALKPGLREVPCHNDLNPSNLICDGTRLWIIDWETACAGERFHDLGALAAFLVRTPELQSRLIRCYLGREPDNTEQARFDLSRGLSLACFATTLCLAAPAGEPWHYEPAPSFDEAIALMATGPGNRPKTAPVWLGRAFAEEALNLRASRTWKDAIAALA